MEIQNHTQRYWEDPSGSLFCCQFICDAYLKVSGDYWSRYYERSGVYAARIAKYSFPESTITWWRNNNIQHAGICEMKVSIRLQFTWTFPMQVASTPFSLGHLSNTAIKSILNELNEYGKILNNLRGWIQRYVHQKDHYGSLVLIKAIGCSARIVVLVKLVKRLQFVWPGCFKHLKGAWAALKSTIVKHKVSYLLIGYLSILIVMYCRWQIHYLNIEAQEYVGSITQSIPSDLSSYHAASYVR